MATRTREGTIDGGKPIDSTRTYANGDTYTGDILSNKHCIRRASIDTLTIVGAALQKYSLRRRRKPKKSPGCNHHGKRRRSISNLPTWISYLKDDVEPDPNSHVGEIGLCVAMYNINPMTNEKVLGATIESQMHFEFSAWFNGIIISWCSSMLGTIHKLHENHQDDMHFLFQRVMHLLLPRLRKWRWDKSNRREPQT